MNGRAYFSSSSGQWIKRHKNDFYVKLSKENDLRSRAAYKFIEINEKYKFIRAKDLILGIMGFLINFIYDWNIC
jgi:23S rRNA U2552 (ribose-2'-O)-methylase RlmE/FtsJ